MGRKFFFIPLLIAAAALGALEARGVVETGPVLRAAGPTTGGGDPQIAAAQQLLQRAQLYTGEITGELDRKTEMALRHFQMLRNLPVTGKMDEGTVAQLHLPPKDLILADREFLENAPPPVPDPTPAGQQLPPGPSPVATPEKKVEIPPKSVQTFLNYYLKAASYRKAKPELTYFAGTVDYFDQGTITQEQLESELSRDRSRRFTLVAVDEVTPLAQPNRVAIRFTVRITPLTRHGRQRPASNVEKREATLERAPEGTLKLTSIRKTE